MKQVPLNQVKDNLPEYLRLAETEDIIITQQGMPAGILIGFANREEWWEELILRHPKFQECITQARESLRDRGGRSIEELREKYAAEAQQ